MPHADARSSERILSIDEGISRETILTTVTSAEFGLANGTLADLDAAVRLLRREQVAYRVVAVLTGLAADRESGGRNVSLTFARALGERGKDLRNLLAKPNAIFIEPLQQLIILRRALTVCGEGEHDAWSDEGIATYVEACRVASDLSQGEAAEGLDDWNSPEGWTRIAAVFLTRMGLLNPLHPTNWIARLRLLLNDIPARHEKAQPLVAALRQRLVDSFGLTFEHLLRLVQLFGLWMTRFRSLDEVFAPDAPIALNVNTWLSQTRLNASQLTSFFNRTSRSVDEVLSDASFGGPTSILPFRDRPFLRFSQGIAPVHPLLVIEKLSYDLFWWSTTPDSKQDNPWQRDWGDLIELYVIDLLRHLADKYGCGFAADVRWDAGQLDAAMWFKGHVALFEVSAGMLTDAAAYGGSAKALHDGLYRTFVRSTRGGKSKDEMISQLARDVKLALAGKLPGLPPTPSRIYPVGIAIDRRVRTPALRFWFDHYFADEANDAKDKGKIAGLAVLSLEDLEAAEQLLGEPRRDWRLTPPGLLQLLRRWNLDREKLPTTAKRAAAWHHFAATQSPPTGPHPRLQAEADRWWEEVKGLFVSTDESREVSR